MSQPKPSRDEYFRLKYISYCWAQMPPKEHGITKRDVVKFAQFYLCHKAKRLMKDPVWNEYTQEEILVEYFAHLMVEDKAFKDLFEAQLGSNGELIEEAVDEFLSFINKVTKKDEQELEKRALALPDSISFKPQKD